MTLKEVIHVVRKEREEAKSAQDHLTQELHKEKTRVENLKNELENLKRSKKEHEEQCQMIESQLKRG